MEQQDTLTLGVNPTKMLLYLGGCLIFVIGGVWMVFSGNLIGWLAILFFGLGVVVFSIQLFSSNASYLRLTPEGFTMQSLFRSHSYRWSEVEGFAVADISVKHKVAGSTLDAVGHALDIAGEVGGVGNPSGHEMVVFNFSSSYKGQDTARKAVKKFSAMKRLCRTLMG